MKRFVFIWIALVTVPLFCMGGQNAIVLSSSSSKSVEFVKLASDIYSDGDTATVITAEEADVHQAGLLNSGGPVVVAEQSRGED